MFSSILLMITLSSAIFRPAESIQLDGIRHYDVVDVEKITDLNIKQDDEQAANQNLNIDVYEDEVEYSFTGLSKNFHLKLQRNDLLIYPGAKLIHQAADGSQLVKADALESCYYQGELRDEEGSSAVVSTCGGRLNGFLKDSNGVEYGITPHPEDETKHVLYKDSDVVPRKNASKYKCGYHDDPQKPAPYPDDSSFLFDSSQHKMEKRSVIAWKYMEVIPVISNQLYKEFQQSVNNQHALSKAIQNKVLQIFNLVDAFYKMINSRMVVTNIIVWDKKDYGIKPALDSEPTLTHFTNYARDELFKKGLRYDHVALLTVDGSNWGDTLGLAYRGHMCNIDATSVNRIPLGVPDHRNADLLTHEIGHSVGFDHTHKCGSGKCENPPCLMQSHEYEGIAKGFSQCNVNVFKTLVSGGKLPCILEYPRKFLQRARCGNGFVEAGEQCDCGSEEECRKQGLNSCCDHTTCKLKREAQCAVGACCHKCKFKPPTTQCRAKAHPDCDLEEFCTGTSEHCPENTYRHAGTPCAGGSSYCFLDECKSLDAQCKKIWGPKGGKAGDDCYDINTSLNPEAPSSANCGKNDAGKFVACADSDKFCGKLFCGRASPGVSMPKHSTIGRSITWTWGKDAGTCKTVDNEGHVAGDTADPTYVETGTKCGHESVCVQHKCVHISTLVKKNCSPPCKDGAVCNNKGVCQCPAGASCSNGAQGSSKEKDKQTGKNSNGAQAHPCDKSNGGCAHICVRKGGAAVCSCNRGFVLDKDKRSCKKVHPCDKSNGGCAHICVRKGTHAVCRCNEGFVLDKDKKSCKKDYECVLKPGDGDSDEEYAGELTGDECVRKCWEMQKNNKRINGVVMYQDGTLDCWCELGMMEIMEDSTYKACFFDYNSKDAALEELEEWGK